MRPGLTRPALRAAALRAAASTADGRKLLRESRQKIADARAEMLERIAVLNTLMPLAEARQVADAEQARDQLQANVAEADAYLRRIDKALGRIAV